MVLSEEVVLKHGEVDWERHREHARCRSECFDDLVSHRLLEALDEGVLELILCQAHALDSLADRLLITLTPSLVHLRFVTQIVQIAEPLPRGHIPLKKLLNAGFTEQDAHPIGHDGCCLRILCVPYVGSEKLAERCRGLALRNFGTSIDIRNSNLLFLRGALQQTHCWIFSLVSSGGLLGCLACCLVKSVRIGPLLDSLGL